MIRSSNHRRRPACVRDRGGFTLIEILMVVIIISILLALLLPAINASIRSARQAAVSSEINQLAQALANFKSKYGDYPPSRVLLAENGLFPIGNTTLVNTGDITDGALAQRTLIALRKFFPRVVFSTQSVVWGPKSTTWYDFNGNGVFDANFYILEGHECLVFFLGGIPLADNPTSPTKFSMTGFGKDPTNPFTNNIAADSRLAGPPFPPNAMYNGNRQPPIFEFNNSRLFLDPNNLSNNGVNPGIPGYYDSLATAPPGSGNGTANFYAYFSAYGSGVYDPNDINFGGPTLSESDASGVSPIGLQFQYGTTLFTSPSPNPYTSTLSVTTTGTVTFQNAQSFQIFSAGLDGLYGVGGQYVPASTTAASSSTVLPFDANNTFAKAAVTTDASIRQRERDNLTNFKAGTLQ